MQEWRGLVEFSAGAGLVRTTDMFHGFYSLVTVLSCTMCDLAPKGIPCTPCTWQLKKHFMILNSFWYRQEWDFKKQSNFCVFSLKFAILAYLDVFGSVGAIK